MDGRCVRLRECALKRVYITWNFLLPSPRTIKKRPFNRHENYCNFIRCPTSFAINCIFARIVKLLNNVCIFNFSSTNAINKNLYKDIGYLDSSITQYHRKGFYLLLNNTLEKIRFLIFFVDLIHLKFLANYTKYLKNVKKMNFTRVKFVWL